MAFLKRSSNEYPGQDVINRRLAEDRRLQRLAHEEKRGPVRICRCGVGCLVLRSICPYVQGGEAGGDGPETLSAEVERLRKVLRHVGEIAQRGLNG